MALLHRVRRNIAVQAALLVGAWLPSTARAEPLQTTVSLSDWGLTSIDELAFARLGVLDTTPGRLVVYHIGRADPGHGVESERSAPPRFAAGAFLVQPDGNNANALGGLFNGFARAPARSEVSIEPGPDGVDALAFAYDKRPGTFAGFWMHLFDTRAAAPDRVYLDARGAAWLTFEIRGDVGGEPVRLQLADRAWEKKQDSWPVDDVAALIDGGRIDTSWRRAWLSLDRLDQPGSRLDRSRLASLVFLVDPEGQNPRQGRVWIRGVALTTPRTAPTVAMRPTAIARPEKKAMWLWETRRIIDSAAELERLVAFCRAQAMTDLFVQLPYTAPLIDNQWGQTWDQAGMQRFNAALHPVRVHALDGAAFYVRPEWHPRLVTTVAQVAAYNKAHRPAERFAGVRFDVEPYLLDAWQGSGKEAVLRDYVALLGKLATAAHKGGLSFGVDIPFWFDGRDELTGALAAPYEGRPVLERVLDLVDNIGVMDYRTLAYGADGVLTHGANELALATAKKKEVFIGLETVKLPDERLLTFDERRGAGETLIVSALAGGRARLELLPAGTPIPAGARTLGLRDAILVPADKLTFANLGRAALERTMMLARPALLAEPSFVGFVLHSYESLDAWYR